MGPSSGRRRRRSNDRAMRGRSSRPRWAGHEFPLRPPRRRRGLRQEGLAYEAQDLRAAALDDRLQPAELQPHELDSADGADGLEAEVREEIAREDRLVHLEALVPGLALGKAVGERLERGGA